MTLHAFDVSGLTWWQHFASAKRNDLISQESGALQGLLEYAARSYKPGDRVVACLDGGNNWRKDPARGGSVEYKAHRTEIDPVLQRQLDAVEGVLRKAGICTLRHDDYEADDVIATVVEWFGPETEIIIHSSDKDLCQLVGDGVKQYDGKYEKLYGPAEVLEKFGVAPSRMVDYLALVGDEADGVRGVTGWGKKTAVAGVEQSVNADNLVNQAHMRQLRKPITDRHQEVLCHQMAVFFGCRNLIALRNQLTLPPVSLDDMTYDGQIDISALSEFLQ